MNSTPPPQDDLPTLLKVRREKLEQIKASGIHPFPYKYERTHDASGITGDFEALEGKEVSIAGRLMSIRLMGKASFGHIQDMSGRIQIYVQLDSIGEASFEVFKLLDIGDIIGVKGVLFKTRTEEKSVRVKEVRVLSKSLMSLPEKWHGLKDQEIKYRRLYINTL